MPNGEDLKGQPDTAAQAKPGLVDRGTGWLTRANQKFTFLLSLPIVGALGSAIAGHFDYLSAYQDKVKTAAKEQVAAAESSFTDVSTTFSQAITLQQVLFFNYRDAINAHSDGDDRGMESKNARAIYPKYNDLRMSIRESIDLLARKVEMSLDWPANLLRDPADPDTFKVDLMSRIALGSHNFDCDAQQEMPNFIPGKSQITLDPPPELLKENPHAKPLHIDWYSAKHQLLTLYYCFDVNHRKIAVVRQWAANSPVDAQARGEFVQNLNAIQASFDQEALRLHDFMTLAAGRIEVIRVKFRPTAWYCHILVVREIVDAYSKTCKPIRTAKLSAPAKVIA